MRLFISYAHANYKKVKQLAEMLQEVGHEVWYDEELAGGEDWWQGILTEIERCDVFVFALSPQSRNSDACQAEYKYAIRMRKIILPIRLEAVEMPTDLKSVHYEDFFGYNQRKTALTLARALNHLQRQLWLESRVPPADSNPTRPLFPFKPDYIEALRLRAKVLNKLTPHELLELVYTLKQVAREHDKKSALEARAVLREMLQSPHITLGVQEEIREALRGSRIIDWRVYAAGAAAVFITVIFGGVLLFSSKGNDNAAAESEQTDGAAFPLVVSTNAQTQDALALLPVAPAGDQVTLAFTYFSDQPLTLHFETTATAVWLFGLELRWQNDQRLRFNDFYYSQQWDLNNFPITTCIQLMTFNMTPDPACLTAQVEDAFWLEQDGLFSIWQGDRQIGLCGTDQPTCNATWSNTPADRQNAGVEMILEWVNSDLITLRFETVQQMLDLSEVTFTVPLSTGSERLYHLGAFNQLNRLEGFNLRQFPANGCIVLGAKRSVELPADSRCTGGLFFDNRAIETTQGAFWEPLLRQFEVRAGNLVLQECSTTTNQCRVRLDH